MILKLYYVRNMIHNNNTYIFYQISISSNLQPNGTRRLLQANHKQSNIRNERSEQQFTAGRGIWTNQCWYGKSTSNEEASHMACLGSAQWQVISCRNEMRLYRGECCSLQKIKKSHSCVPKFSRTGIEPVTDGYQHNLSTVHRSTNWAIASTHILLLLLHYTTLLITITLCQSCTMSSRTETRTQVSCVKGKYANHLHHTGLSNWPTNWRFCKNPSYHWILLHTISNPITIQIHLTAPSLIQTLPIIDIYHTALHHVNDAHSAN